jgi:two-component system response regulator MprA
VWRGDRALRLTRTEFSIFEVFPLHPRQVLTRAVLFERVWGYDFGESSNSVHVYLG